MAEVSAGGIKSQDNVEGKEINFNNKKLTLALSKLLEEALTISDDTILEKLFSHLVKKIKSDGYSRKTLAEYVLWLCLVMKRWDSVQCNVQVFSIRLAGVICSMPIGFLMLEEQKVIGMVTERIQQQSHIDSSLLLAVVNFISEAVKHEVGCNWVIQTEIWRSAVKLCHMDDSMFTSKASANLITSLVLIFEQSHIDVCYLVVDAIVKPLCISRTKESPIVYGDLLPKDKHNESTPVDHAICKKTPINPEVPLRVLLATIKFLNHVLDGLLMSKMSVERVNNIFKYYSLEMWAWEQVHVHNYDVELLRSVSSTLTLLNFLGTVHSVQGEMFYSDVELLSVAMLRLIETMIYKRQFALVFDICVHCQKLRQMVIKKVVYNDTEMQEAAFDFGNQLVIVQSLPLFVFVKVSTVHRSDVMDKYSEKLFAVSHSETLRVCYQFRELLRCTPNLNMGLLSQQAVVSMMRCINCVDREQAVIIFQTMIHVLRQFVPEEYFESSSVILYESQSLLNRCPILLMHLLECITAFMNKFHIKWYESLETLCLLTFSQVLISNPDITPRLCAQTLKLIQQLIENFIPPSLALLMNTLKNSSIEKLGSLLLSKLHDNSWEVRDSTLEVLQVIGRLSDVLFPAFQTLMLEPQLLDVVLSLVVNDLESYVRGTAMTCLCDLVKVQNLWDRKLSSMSLPKIAIDFVRNDTEGLVRKAACQLVTTIYKHQKVSSNIEKEFHVVMFYAAVHDLYWEVKKAAIDFWEAVVDQELTNEGMIDGAFPGFTFSKQSRKIVSLTHQEIQKRLTRVLTNLARVGCLQVLWTSLNDECDLEVVRAAVRVIHKLMNLLMLYSNDDRQANVDGHVNRSQRSLVYETFGAESNFACSEHDYFSENCVEEEMPCESTQNVHLSTENIINQIVEHDDIDLLSSVYKLNSDRGHVNITKTKQELITPKKFLAELVALDIDEVVNSRSNWLQNASENLESLLDDVLAVNCDLPEHINNVGLDCY